MISSWFERMISHTGTETRPRLLREAAKLVWKNCSVNLISLGLVNNLESLLLHGNEDFREQILDREEGAKQKVKSKRIWHEKEIRFR